MSKTILWTCTLSVLLILTPSVSPDAGVEEVDQDHQDAKINAKQPIVASSWTEGWSSKIMGWESYLKNFDINAIFSNSGEDLSGERKKKPLAPNIKGTAEGDGVKKPSYLYSAGSIRSLAKLEAGIYAAVKEYVEGVEHRVNLMKRYMKDYEDSSVNMMRGYDDPKIRDYTVVANPIIAHRLIRRFSLDFKDIIKTFEYAEDEEFLEAINAANPDVLQFPTVEEDYNQSMNALLRIQRYTNMDGNDIMRGKLGHLETGIGLESRHAFEIGEYAEIKEQYASAIDWLEIALDKLKEEDEDATVEAKMHKIDPEYKDKIEGVLEMAAEKHDELCSTNHWTSAMDHCFTHLIDGYFGNNRRERKRVKMIIKNQNNSKKFRTDEQYSGHTRRNFISTCAGNNLMNETEKSGLHCWYERKKHPYLTISPAKMEVLYKNPPVVQIYDMLTQNQIDTLIRTATPTLERSQVINTEDPKANDVSDVRTSVQTWIYDSDKSLQYFLDNISKRIEYVTGLNVRPPKGSKGRRASEAYQVASYRTSHHYDEHMDALKDERRTFADGDRLATFMLYLTDVDAGGYTGFPNFGTAARPVGGSAVFWYNLRKSGDPDYRTWHGGCPVVHGVKWVCNKWILYKENFNKSQCSLDRNE